MMPAGVKSKTSRTARAISASGTVFVPCVVTWTLTGSVCPMLYASWIWHRLARPAATTFFAAHREA